MRSDWTRHDAKGSTRCTCSTSRRSGCTWPTSKSSCASCTAWSPPATPSSSSNTISTSWPKPIGSSTSAPKAATAAAASSRRALPMPSCASPARAIRQEYSASFWRSAEFPDGGPLPASDDRSRGGSRTVSCIWGPRRLDEQHVRLLISDRAMLHSARHDKDLSRAKNHIALSHLNCHSALQDEEKIVRIVVLVPGKWTVHFDDHQIVAIELTHGSRFEMLRERG